jgi:hypothetical protein
MRKIVVHEIRLDVLFVNSKKGKAIPVTGLEGL